jgi:hypothetical protein
MPWQKIIENFNFVQCEFPPAWSSVAAFGWSGERRSLWLWNRAHPLSRQIEREDLEWFAGLSGSQVSADLLRTSGRTALYLMEVLRHSAFTLEYDQSEEFRPGFWRELWDNVGLSPAEIVAWRQDHNGEGYLDLLRPEGLETIPGTDLRIPKYLPDPGDEWKLAITYKDSSNDS